MTALLYFLVAVAAAALSTRAWLLDRDASDRKAFLALGWAVAVAYLGFSLSLLPGLGSARLLYTLAGCFVPPGALWVADRLFDKSDRPVSSTVGRLYLITTITAPVAIGLDWTWFGSGPSTTPVEVLIGLFVFGSFAFTLVRLRDAWHATTLRVDRVRLGYLGTFIAGAVLFTLLEQLGRVLWPPGDLALLTMARRGLVLQGPLPPFSALLAVTALYFLYHSLMMSRLVDLNEALSRLAALLLSAGMLVLIDGVTFVWVGTFTDYPVHSTFQIFLGSLVFLAAYDPLRDWVGWATDRVINQRGQQLAQTLESLRHDLPSVISAEGLSRTLLSGLHASGRVPISSLYLWSAHHDAFVCFGARGDAPHPPLKAVAAHPFTDGFAEGTPWYSHTTLARRARTEAIDGEVLQLMGAMNADITMPFLNQGVVMGWFNLRDEQWSDGFSADELQRMTAVAERGAIVLSNIEGIQQLEEEHRLAALGAMAAGLAHEIRNPLAGLKGAAQYLEGEDLADDAHDMLSVIVDEANRLDVVVSQFLDYARPLRLDLAPDHINALITRGLNLLRAQGVPDNIEVVEQLSGDLPAMLLDSAKLGQVVLNLLQNALQAMPEGGTLTVQTRVRPKRGMPYLELVVSDTGSGISHEDRQRIFVPFFTTKKGGTGLGLAISQRIVQAHQGEVEVQSHPGRGATLIVRIPYPSNASSESIHLEATAEPTD